MTEDKLSIKKTGTTLYINLGYQLSVENAPNLQESLNAYTKQDIEKIVFDATDLVHLSSVGVRVIMFAHNKFKKKPKIIFVNCAKAIYDTLDLVGITNIIRFVEKKTSKSESSDSEWQEKLAELRQKDLEDFAAHNDVVVYQMKIGNNTDE